MPVCRRCKHTNPEGARFCNACGAPFERQREERRKPATLLFCDVSGSTALGELIDAEAMREVMFAYFREVRAVIERHGGTVEKFIGDAVLGAFGVPIAHEDDPLRAVRAALEMTARLPALNAELERRYGTRLALRTGINTGEVVAGDPAAREAFVSGDAVNVAARLEQVAEPGEILLGEATFALVRDEVEAERLAPRELKGKAAAVTAYRVVRLRTNPVPARDRETALVGREPELAALEAALERVRAASRPERIVLVGEAGVGKSRLVRCFLDTTAETALVLSARCLPYGEGITYSPLVQLLRQAAGIDGSADRPDARAHLDALLGEAEGAEAIASILAQVLGLAEGVASAEEIAWAARGAAEALARERTLILLVDDLQWGEAPFVELVESIAERCLAPILVLCLARPELEERHPEWQPDVRLEPLPATHAAELLRGLLGTQLLDDDARARVLAAAGGNPLFLEELVAFVSASGDPTAIPPTLDALLSAHLDTLDASERGTLERSSVEGEVFHHGAVTALSEPIDPATTDEALRRLLAKELLREATSSFVREHAYRFRHLLVRDVAYRSVPKRRRADLHVRFAGWLEAKLGDRLLELAEIVAYHLEQAWRLRAELGPVDTATVGVGARASELLAGAARRALARADSASALNLFTRASELAATDPDRLGLELERGIAAREAGDFALAGSILASVGEKAAATAAAGIGARASIELALIRHHTTPGAVAELRRVAEAARALFEELGDEEGLAVALTTLAEERWIALRCAEMEQLLEEALVHAERAGDERLIAGVVVPLARAVLFGPRPASAAAARCEQLLARARRIGPTVEANISMMLAVLEAAQGHAERSSELARHSKGVIEQLAAGPRVAIAGQYAGLAALISGDATAAERELRASYELLDRLGERAIASTVAALLARALVELGRHAEAEGLAARSLEWADAGDLASQAYGRSAWGCALVARGATDEARRHVREAVELSETSDFTNQRGDAFFDLAVVLQACGDSDGASEAAASALALFEAKENRVSAARAAALAAG